MDAGDESKAITALRAAYAAFNRGDIDAAVEFCDPQIEWSEPAEFPGGGMYQGRDEAKRYLSQSRAAWADVISEPELELKIQVVKKLIHLVTTAWSGYGWLSSRH